MSDAYEPVYDRAGEFEQLFGINNAATVVGVSGPPAPNPLQGLVGTPSASGVSFTITNLPNTSGTDILGINTLGVTVGAAPPATRRSASARTARRPTSLPPARPARTLLSWATAILRCTKAAAARRRISAAAPADITGGRGADVYVSTQGQSGGTDVLRDFRIGIDHVRLVGYGNEEVRNALASSTVAGGSATVTLSDSTRLEFAGVTGLSAQVFVT